MIFLLTQSVTRLIRNKCTLLYIGLISISIQVFAQQPPTGHAAVWKNVQEYWSSWAERDLDGYMKFHHAGYSGWFHNSPAHRGKKVARQWFENQFEQLEVIFYELNAIDIKIHNNTAVTHYYVTSIERNSKGKEFKKTLKRTDHYIYENERWLLIAHHDTLE